MKLIDKVKKKAPEWKQKLRELVSERQEYKARIERLEARNAVLNDKIIALLEAEGRQNAKLKGIGTISVVKSQGETVDLPRLLQHYEKKGLKPPVNMMPVLDIGKLELDIKRQKISPEELAKYVVKTERKPYIRVDTR